MNIECRCCICSTTSQNGRNIHQDLFGTPPILISSIIKQFVVMEQLKSENICSECEGELLKYYNALQLMENIEKSLLKLMFKSESKETSECLNKNNLDDESKDSTEHFKSESQSDEKNESRDFEEDSNQTAIKEEVQSSDLFWHDFVTPENDSCEEIIEEFLTDLEPQQKDDPLNEESNDNSLSRKEFKCPTCDEAFVLERKLKGHIRKKHPQGFLCDLCGKTLGSQPGFLSHMRNHNPVKMYPCPTCDKRYNTKKDLKVHIAWHSGERPFQCNICSKTYAHQIALQAHQVIHSGVRQFACHLCDFTFYKSGHLKRHISTHEGIKPHCCPICGKCFSLAYNMRVHIQEHENPGSTRRNRLKCKKCCRTFTNKQNYEAHTTLESCDEIPRRQKKIKNESISMNQSDSTQAP